MCNVGLGLFWSYHSFPALHFTILFWDILSQ